MNENCEDKPLIAKISSLLISNKRLYCSICLIVLVTQLCNFQSIN